MRFWLSLALVLCAGTAQACECETLPFDETVRASTLAFTGTVDRVGLDGKAVFEVHSILRGIPIRRAVVEPRHSGAGDACFPLFLVGQNYTVVVRGTYDSGYYTDICQLKAAAAIPQDESNKFEVLRQRGAYLLQIHSAEYALSTFTRAAAESNNADEDLLGQGEASLQLGQSREALSFFDDVIEHDVKNKQAWSGRYRALAQMGRWSEIPVEGSDLTASELDGVALTSDLKAPIFRKAWWQHVKAEGRKLSKADFSGALLSHVNFAKADLSGANFSGIKGQAINLNGANLNGADLRGADLSGATLQGAKLNGVLKDKATRLP